MPTPTVRVETTCGHVATFLADRPVRGWEPAPKVPAESDREPHLCRWEALAKEMAVVLHDLSAHETDPCHLDDHHGHCQQHGWSEDGECPIPRAHRVRGKFAAMVAAAATAD